MEQFIIIGGGCYGTYHTRQLYRAIQKSKLQDCQLVVVDRNAEPEIKKEFSSNHNIKFVQSDWHTYLMEIFDNSPPKDPSGETFRIIPPPFAPHLYFDWLRASTQKKLEEAGRGEIKVGREGFEYKMNLPYEFTDKTGNHFISRAGWTCPATCIEPHLCPAVKGVRDWDLEFDLRDFVNGQMPGPSVSAANHLKVAGLNNGGTSLAETQVPFPTHFEAVETFNCHHYIFGIGAIAGSKFIEARERTLSLAQTLGPGKREIRIAVGTLSHCHGVVATLHLSLPG